MKQATLIIALSILLAAFLAAAPPSGRAADEPGFEALKNTDATTGAQQPETGYYSEKAVWDRLICRAIRKTKSWVNTWKTVKLKSFEIDLDMIEPPSRLGIGKLAVYWIKIRVSYFYTDNYWQQHYCTDRCGNVSECGGRWRVGNYVDNHTVRLKISKREYDVVMKHFQ